MLAPQSRERPLIGRKPMGSASRRFGAVIFAIGLAVVAASGAAAQTEQQKQLYEAAKKEGQLTWYSGVMDQALCERVGKEFTDMQGTPYIMQREIWLNSRRSACTAPPFGTLTAISLKDGKTLWDVPLGTTEGLDRIGIPPLPDGSGMANLGGAITTAGGVVFIGATLDAYFRAFDVQSGRELWKFKLPAGGKAMPMTYRGKDGRQYVAISAGGDGKAWGKADSIMVFAIPRQE